MKKKKHKWKYQINIKKKILVLIILGVSLFVGLGYAIIGSSLNIFGTLEVAKYDKTLYGVMKKDALNNNALTYSGTHIDSVSEQGNEEIYYYDHYEVNNNVIFAGTCWEMIRTTDVGGVKLLYNGEPVNGTCLDDRGSHVGYNGESETNLNGDYWYGTDYTYDPTANQFVLKGTKEQKHWNDSTYTDLLGKYTCRSTSENATCSTLYYVSDYSTSSRAYTMLIKNTNFYRYFGVSEFNREADSPAYFGYMYDNLIPRVETRLDASYRFRSSSDIYTNSFTLSNTYYYADSYDYGQIAANAYTLTNPIQIDSTTDYSTLVGKYIINGATSGNTIFYIIGMNGTKAYTKGLSNGQTDTTISIGNSIVDNGNSTYSLDGITTIDLKEWYVDYANYNYKYICGDSSTTCTEPRYIYSTDTTDYDYVSATLTISKTRNGFELVNPITITAGDWYNGYNTTYKDYKYSCGNSNTTCTSSNLRYIIDRGYYYYDYLKFQYFGNSVKYENGQYEIKDVIEIEDANNPSNIATHHYMCPTLGETICPEAAYVFYSPSLKDVRYMPLRNEIEKPTDLLDSMLKSNVKNSTIKQALEGWYKKFIYQYDNMIEDSIYCNNRSYDTTEGYTFNESGWNDNGTSSSNYLYFKDRNITDLSCENLTDRFSVANNQAKTKYKVGLMTVSEANLIGNMRSPISGTGYHLMSAREFQAAAFTGRVYYLGNTNGGYAYNEQGVRPVVTLKKGTGYIGGTGTQADPYIAKVEGWSLQSSQFPVSEQKWLYLEDGKKISDGWHQLNDTHGDPNMYYFEDGYSHHGWLELDNNKYYLSTFDDDDNGIIDGRRLTNETREIDGVNYTFDASGICTNCE